MNIGVSDILIKGGRIMEKETTRVGKRGTVVIPAGLRRKYGLSEGSLVIAEAQPEAGLLDQRGRHVVLRRERVGRRQHHVRAAGH